MRPSFANHVTQIGLCVAILSIPAAAQQLECAGAASSVAAADGATLAAEVIEQLGGEPQAWVLYARAADAQAGPEPQGEILAAVRAVNPEIPLVGCFTDTGTFCFRDGQVASGEVLLVGLRGEGMRFTAAMERFNTHAELTAAGARLGEALAPRPDEKGLLLLMTDAVITHDSRFDMPAFYRALQQPLAGRMAVIGGNAAYGEKPVYHNDEIATGAIVGLAITGPSEIKCIAEPGWEPICEPMTITALGDRANEIAELDGRPWQEGYREALQGHWDDMEFFEEATQAGSGGKWGRISRHYPHALVLDRLQLYLRLAHGLSPWSTGDNLPSECYDLQEGMQLVVTRPVADPVGEVVDGIQRLDAHMPEGRRLIVLCPCQSASYLMRQAYRPGDGAVNMREEFFARVTEALPEGATAFGFMPCGEHASWYEPDLDEEVTEARYHQLSFPMAVMVDRTE